MVRITRCGLQSNNPIIFSSSPTGKTCVRRTRLWEFLGIRTRIYASRDEGFCVPKNPEFITGCSECLSFSHCQYTASLDLDTFPEILRSAIIGNYDCEKGLFYKACIPSRNVLIRENDKPWFTSEIRYNIRLRN